MPGELGKANTAYKPVDLLCVETHRWEFYEKYDFIIKKIILAYIAFMPCYTRIWLS